MATYHSSTNSQPYPKQKQLPPIERQPKTPKLVVSDISSEQDRKLNQILGNQEFFLQFQQEFIDSLQTLQNQKDDLVAEKNVLREQYKFISGSLQTLQNKMDDLIAENTALREHCKVTTGFPKHPMTDCAACAAKEKSIGIMKRKLEDSQHGRQRVEKQLQQKQKTIQVASARAMMDMSVQFEGNHDRLIRKYTELMTNPNPPTILGQLEKAFFDPFDAKVELTNIFMMAYDECKSLVIQSVKEHIEQLFTVQSNPDEGSGEPSDVDMEDLSRAYGLLLQATASKTRLACTTKLEMVYGKISQKVNLEHFEEEIFKKKIIKDVIELAWDFVTQSNPLIVCKPEKYSQHIHNLDSIHWEKSCEGYPLVHSCPVLYRSYHGDVANKGIVGNVSPQTSLFV